MKQIIRELKRQVAGEKLEPEQLKGLIRAGYMYRDGDEHLLTDEGRRSSGSAWRVSEGGALAERRGNIGMGNNDGEEGGDNEEGEAKEVACVDA